MIQTSSHYLTITDTQVRAGTGKSWKEWLALLDQWKGDTRSFTEISRYLTRQYQIPHSWAQAIAVYYYQERVLRH